MRCHKTVYHHCRPRLGEFGNSTTDLDEPCPPYSAQRKGKQTRNPHCQCSSLRKLVSVRHNPNRKAALLYLHDHAAVRIFVPHGLRSRDKETTWDLYAGEE